MNQKKARALRRKVYGDDYSPRHRTYHKLDCGMIVADERRREYQRGKKK